MPGFARSTITALCYADPIELDFHDIASNLGGALQNNPQGALDIQSHYDDVVIYEMPGLRIVLAHTDLQAEFSDLNQPGHCAHVMVVSVGTRPDSASATDVFASLHGVEDRGAYLEAAEAQDELRDNLVAWLERVVPADSKLDFKRDTALTEDVYDELVAQIYRQTRDTAKPAAAEAEAAIDAELVIDLPAFDAAEAEVAQAMPIDVDMLDDEMLEALAAEVRDEPEVAEVVSPRHPKLRRPTATGGTLRPFAPVPSGDDLDAMASRCQTEHAAREAAREARLADIEARITEPAHPRATVTPRRIRPTHPAMDADRVSRPQPLVVAPKLPEFNLRPAAIFDDVESEPLVHRAAINALNASMVALALPVGAALLTMAVLGRESLGVSSRATALTGAYLGLSQLGIVHMPQMQQLLSLFS